MKKLQVTRKYNTKYRKKLQKITKELEKDFAEIKPLIELLSNYKNDKSKASTVQIKYKGKTGTLLHIYNQEINRLKDKYRDKTKKIEPLVKKVLNEAVNDNEKRFKKYFKPGKIKKEEFIKKGSVNLFNALQKEGISDLVNAKIRENLNLIKSIPDIYFDKLQELMQDNLTGNYDLSMGITQRLQNLTEATSSRAKLIARDQTTKLIANINEIRYTNLGSKLYRWKNSRDQRVAGNPSGLYPTTTDMLKSTVHNDHWRRQDFVFSWDSPPIDGNPGDGILCRCYADALFEDIDYTVNYEKKIIKLKKKLPAKAPRTVKVNNTIYKLI